ncbi:MAG: DUF2892 domain-containing protein [Thermotogae bacterium]|nr:DUF2892 domain-containing protein [Thermotogota bacterium]
MKCNVGKVDRIVRVVLGLVLLGVAFGLGLTGTLKIVLAVVGLVFLFTAAVGFCLLYLPFGINTCRRE